MMSLALKHGRQKLLYRLFCAIEKEDSYIGILVIIRIRTVYAFALDDILLFLSYILSRPSLFRQKTNINLYEREYRQYGEKT